ncbi:ead/Ea22-like family protein [Serratia marcescens]|uniref:ead/Ea22-like family protein n=1 Tax=Serratia marcescens TaxID=615 RepID=UPI0036FB9BB8
MDKFRELKAAAMAATPGPWKRTITQFNGITNSTHSMASFSAEGVLANANEKRDAIFIAAANPAVVLELLADNEHLARELVARNGENEWLRKRAAELEAKLATPVRLTDERTLWAGEDDYDTGHVKGWNANRIEQAALLKKQGFTVEGDDA